MQTEDLITLLPGERLLHGEVYVFDMDLRNDYIAAELVSAPPEDLTVLSDEALSVLKYVAIRHSFVMCDPLIGMPLLIRVDIERDRRGALS